ncbi:MAG: hypothetical protein F4X92_03080 [Gammaproteobacteria bacterium]|nr:hypothetical protein [Gammaproteobacteria bacterium]
MAKRLIAMSRVPKSTGSGLVALRPDHESLSEDLHGRDCRVLQLQDHPAQIHFPSSMRVEAS